MESFDMLISILGSTIRLSIPLILAALAGLTLALAEGGRRRDGRDDGDGLANVER